MSFEWLKHYMPRSLYARAALILLLPVLTLQLVVSIVFIQRHFEGVTNQLSREAARSVTAMMQAEDPVTRKAFADALALRVTENVDPRTIPDEDRRRWYDFTGIVVIRTLHSRIETLERVSLPDDDAVILYLRDGASMTEVVLSRGRTSASNPHQLFVNMILFGILITIVAFLYLRNQLRPITRLAHAAEAFGKGQILPYSPSGATEVRAAGRAFLSMRARIERQIEQRTMMLSGVSHDLRTPLTRMRLGLSLLEDADREPLERDVEDMQALIDAFLDFARGDAEAGNTEPVEPCAMVQEIVEDCQRGGQSVTLTLCEGAGTVAVRPAAIRRAIENLIGNAVRYGTHCEVSVQLSDKSLRIRVEDDGPGIPADRREDALRPFVRLDPARNQNRGSGVGLGLAIAADIARSHGGLLRLGESEALGGLRVDIVIAR
ncbi:ATP-binding protein [Cognatishimia sp. F0-27]|uniref:ATP-binding protein n=1 Tax=Cognatishimia sp. F0-27 TaxID=2816855 RepID=UPI001D0C3673|nr:ATP-binding protein [Cognatishimia sp. F0-27]MCC1492634.1 HAMP domain-containing protein [Cognatishimia sp. F0-27]